MAIKTVDKMGIDKIEVTIETDRQFTMLYGEK